MHRSICSNPSRIKDFHIWNNPAEVFKFLVFYVSVFSVHQCIVVRTFAKVVSFSSPRLTSLKILFNRKTVVSKDNKWWPESAKLVKYPIIPMTVTNEPLLITFHLVQWFFRYIPKSALIRSANCDSLHNPSPMTLPVCNRSVFEKRSLCW